MLLPILLAACSAPATFEGLSEEVVRAASIPIRSLEPDDVDYRDLQFLKKKIGNARIVMLGEQTHGDGTTFKGKTRLIKFLHKEMGFDVLAWESGMYDCRRMDQAFRAGEKDAASKGIFGLWANSAQIQSLFGYTATSQKSKKRLEMAGFDIQFSAPSTSATFYPDVIGFFDKADKKLLDARTRQVLLAFKERPQSGSDAMLDYFKKQEPEAEGLIRLAAAHRTALEKTHGKRETGFMRRSLENWRQFCQTFSQRSNAPRSAAMNNFRDKGMAETLAYLADDYYKGRKIIVWAASFHNMRSPSTIGAPAQLGYKDTDTFGEVFGRTHHGAAYSIAFTGYEGVAGIAGRPETKVPKAPAGSIEASAKDLGEISFVDLKKLTGKYSARPLGNGNMVGYWGQSFDAMIVTRNMERSTLKAE